MSVTGDITAVDIHKVPVIWVTISPVIGYITAVDSTHTASFSWANMVNSGEITAVDYHTASASGGLISSSGTISAVDSPHQFFITGADIRSGSVLGVDKAHQSSILTGIVISDSTAIPGDSSFVQGSPLGAGDLTLSLSDATYVDGSWSGDGTFFDSTYWEPRPFNPIWINYSIWFLTPPSESPAVLKGTKNRAAANSAVGQYYANMFAPDPGRYEIRWRYQQDQLSFAREVIEPFSVSSSGLSYEPDYS